MLQIRWLMAPVATALLVLSGCSENARRLQTPGGAVEVIEAAPVAPLSIDPLPALAVAPEPVYLEPLPPPVHHTVSAVTSPAGTRQLGQVQSVEVDVEVEGGALGTREIAAVFVSPQGLVWQRQAALIAGPGTGKAVASFSLPVAATFIADQHLFGTWQIHTLDDGVKQASATFALEE